MAQMLGRAPEQTGGPPPPHNQPASSVCYTHTDTLCLIIIIMLILTVAETIVRAAYGNSNCFEVKVGIHQGSALSPLLFVIVMKALSREFRVALPWELLYADHLVEIARTEDDLRSN